jgi:prophage regulatory protein
MKDTLSPNAGNEALAREPASQKMGKMPRLAAKVVPGRPEASSNTGKNQDSASDQSPGCGSQPHTRENDRPTSTVAASGNSKPIVILRIKQVMARTGVKRSTIYDWLNPEDPRYCPQFPRQVKLGASAVGWVESEIDAFLATLVKTSRPQDALTNGQGA